MQLHNTTTDSNPQKPDVKLAPAAGGTAAVTAVSIRLATVLAALLAINTAVQLWTAVGYTVASASGQVRSGNEPPPFPNQNETQRRVETQLIEANSRLGRIEAKLDKPLSVKITEMPPVIVSNISAMQKESGKEAAKSEGKE